MYKKDDIVYADAYKYLKHKKVNAIGFAIPGELEDFEEYDIDMNTLSTEDDAITLNGILKINVDKWDHKWLKTKVICSRYSNDDQIAIMLNGDELAMQRMQRWRDFADDISVVAREYNELKTKFEVTV